MISIPPVQAIGDENPSRTLWAWTVATFFGAGLLRPGPGTWGSLAAAAIWFLCGRLGAAGPLKLSFAGLAWTTITAAFAALIIGIPAGNITAREFGRKDPGFVVIDEVVGQWIALIAAPTDWKFVILAVIFFRGFDVWKPWPARQLERLPGGWGIMFDDVAAGFYALLCMQLLKHWL